MPVAVLLLALVLAPSVAHAYLDPGSGSYVLQILLAGIVAGLFTLKLFWVRVLGFFSNLFGRRGAGKPGDE
jgi:hypothetical protein